MEQSVALMGQGGAPRADRDWNSKCEAHPRCQKLRMGSLLIVALSIILWAEMVQGLGRTPTRYQVKLGDLDKPVHQPIVVPQWARVDHGPTDYLAPTIALLVVNALHVPREAHHKCQPVAVDGRPAGGPRGLLQQIAVVSPYTQVRHEHIERMGQRSVHVAARLQHP